MKQKLKMDSKQKIKVSIVRCSSYDKASVAKAIKQSLENIGFETKKYKNKKVLIKPNILGSYHPSKAITTHPEIVFSVAKIFKEADAEVDVGESFNPFGIKLSDSFKKTGIQSAAEKAGAKVVHFLSNDAKEWHNEKNEVLKKVRLPKQLNDYDLIVNLPKMKTHSLVRYTGAVKNTFGFVPGGQKPTYHVVGKNEQKFSKMILDIYQTIPNMNLNIIDGIIGLEGEGPGTAGRPKKSNLIICSENALAADIVAAEIMCFKDDEVLTNKFGKERNLVGEIETVGEKIKDVKINFKKANSSIGGIIPIIAPFFFKIVAKRPFIHQEKCKRCQACVKICPPKAMSFDKNKKKVCINKKECIMCYCCSEICPYDAITLEQSKLAKTLIKIKNRIMGE
ncbi:MAG: DUF362 domain-containing protein [Nanoarchaeota archaeon]|nr:DUF362 domain-containing protein [Nanoarchaeota archaeon]